MNKEERRGEKRREEKRREEERRGEIRKRKGGRGGKRMKKFSFTIS